MKYLGCRIYLRRLLPEDVTQEYVNWMKDDEITQYLESRWLSHSLESIKEYVEDMSREPNDFLLGIFLNETGRHIGNIKIGDINKMHEFGCIGLIIGEKSVWGKGFGAEAIVLATKYAFDCLKLNKVIAGIYENNIGSYKAFLKAGYREVGRYKNHRHYKNKFVDEIIVEKCKTEVG